MSTATYTPREWYSAMVVALERGKPELARACAAVLHRWAAVRPGEAVYFRRERLANVEAVLHAPRPEPEPNP